MELTKIKAFGRGEQINDMLIIWVQIYISFVHKNCSIALLSFGRSLLNLLLMAQLQ